MYYKKILYKLCIEYSIYINEWMSIVRPNVHHPITNNDNAPLSPTENFASYVWRCLVLPGGVSRCPVPIRCCLWNISKIKYQISPLTDTAHYQTPHLMYHNILIFYSPLPLFHSLSWLSTFLHSYWHFYTYIYIFKNYKTLFSLEIKKLLFFFGT